MFQSYVTLTSAELVIFVSSLCSSSVSKDQVLWRLRIKCGCVTATTTAAATTTTTKETTNNVFPVELGQRSVSQKQETQGS